MTSAPTATWLFSRRVAMAASLVCTQGACSLGSLDYLQNGARRDGAIGDNRVMDMSSPDTATSGGSRGAGGTTSIGGVTSPDGNASGGFTSTGGTTATDGTTRTGGSATTGGTPSIGGTTSTTGNTIMGGTTTTGGTDSDAGTVPGDAGQDVSATGEMLAGGSNSATGGSSGAGGVTSMGGTAGAGAANSAGGTAATGGTTATGGTAATGGTTATGGTAATDGTTATGGSAATGGITNAGGTTSAVTTTCPGAVPTGITSSFCSCAQEGQWANGSYTYYNNIWGSGPGAQCIWATAATKWGVTANHPTTSGVKSYPNISVLPAKVISAIKSYTSSFDVTVPSSGSWDVTYDLGVRGTTSARIDVMLWMNSNGAVQPIASSGASVPVADKTNVSVGGHTWNVFFGRGSDSDVVSFVRTSNVTSGTVDIQAILLWVVANNTTQYGVFTTSSTLYQVQFGFEITSDGSPQAFVSNSFLVTSS